MADLQECGVLPDLWYADNSESAPWWVVREPWVYSTSFETPEGLSAASLLFDGVDYNASFTLNGAALGHHYGAFVPVAFEVGPLLRHGDGESNWLEVTLHSPPAALIAPLYNATPAAPVQQYGVDHCLEARLWPFWKSALNHWDFAPKYWQIGLWRGVTLRAHHRVAALGPTPPTVLVHLPDGAPPYDAASLEVRAEARRLAEVHAGAASLSVRWSVRCTTDASAPPLTHTARANLSTSSPSLLRAELSLASPRLWWPNGYGEQHMYELNVTLLLDADDNDTVVVDATSVAFGVRQLRYARNAVSSPPSPSSSSPSSSPWWPYNQYNHGCSPCLLNSSDYPYYSEPASGYPDPRAWQLVVNGVAVFARGANWVPGDLAYGRLVADRPRFRRLLAMAKAAGFTFLRVWGGGVVEDQLFYDLCDEFGILVQQDMPLAGCGFDMAGEPPSWDWLSAPSGEDGASWLSAMAQQLPPLVAQLASHPSVVRYSLGNELYLNRSWSPVELQYEQRMQSLDPTRVAREADPTNVGQRHGPYHFSIVDGAGYDAWGGRWDAPSSCSSANLATDAGCCEDAGRDDGAGCRYSQHDGGPGDPFEWSEFGANGISDVETLRRVLPAASLVPSAVGDSMWQVHKAGMWLDSGSWAPLFAPAGAPRNASAFATLERVVQASQYAQAEGYRFAYQAGRRRKPHRSLMASWTFNEPWPNAAHGCVLDYFGLPKMAFYWARDALRTSDASLAYSSVTQRAAERLRAEAWVDTESDTLAVASVVVEYFDALAGARIGAESLVGGVARRATPLRLGQLRFVPPLAMRGRVLLARLKATSPTSEAISNDYFFAVVDDVAPVDAPGDAMPGVAGPLAPLFEAPTVELRLSLVGGGSASVASLNVSVVGNDGSAASTAAAPPAASPAAAVALFVKPTARDAAGGQLGYVAFSRGFFSLMPGETAELGVVGEPLWDVASWCVEAWNAPRACLPAAPAAQPLK